jgi:hypothetical protein
LAVIFASSLGRWFATYRTMSRRLQDAGFSAEVLAAGIDGTCLLLRPWAAGLWWRLTLVVL